MKNLIKSWVIWVTFWMAPLSAFANNFHDKWLQKDINTELFINLDNTADSSENIGQLNVIWIEPKIVIDAVLNYFDEDVKMYKLSSQARQKLVSVLDPYLRSHPILVISKRRKMEFVIDDKREFALMVKQFVNTVLDDMPFLVRKVAIPLFFGGNDAIQQKLDNLDETVMNLKEKQYKDVILDYIWSIVKKVAKTVDWKMTVKEYYDDVSGYYPNKNWTHIVQELDALGQSNIDIKLLKYPFKK